MKQRSCVLITFCVWFVLQTKLNRTESVCDFGFVENGYTWSNQLSADFLTGLTWTIFKIKIWKRGDELYEGNAVFFHFMSVLNPRHCRLCTLNMQKFQDIEEDHLRKMKQLIKSYSHSIEDTHVQVGQVRTPDWWLTEISVGFLWFSSCVTTSFSVLRFMRSSSRTWKTLESGVWFRSLLSRRALGKTGQVPHTCLDLDVDAL